jgi:hypothetical protein
MNLHAVAPLQGRPSGGLNMSDCAAAARRRRRGLLILLTLSALSWLLIGGLILSLM